MKAGEKSSSPHQGAGLGSPWPPSGSFRVPLGHRRHFLRGASAHLRYRVLGWGCGGRGSRGGCGAIPGAGGRGGPKWLLQWAGARPAAAWGPHPGLARFHPAWGREALGPGAARGFLAPGLSRCEDRSLGKDCCAPMGPCMCAWAGGCCGRIGKPPGPPCPGGIWPGCCWRCCWYWCCAGGRGPGGVHPRGPQGHAWRAMGASAARGNRGSASPGGARTPFRHPREPRRAVPAPVAPSRAWACPRPLDVRCTRGARWGLGMLPAHGAPPWATVVGRPRDALPPRGQHPVDAALVCLRLPLTPAPGGGPPIGAAPRRSGARLHGGSCPGLPLCVPLCAPRPALITVAPSAAVLQALAAVPWAAPGRDGPWLLLPVRPCLLPSLGPAASFLCPMLQRSQHQACP